MYHIAHLTLDPEVTKWLERKSSQSFLNAVGSIGKNWKHFPQRDTLQPRDHLWNMKHDTHDTIQSRKARQVKPKKLKMCHSIKFPAQKISMAMQPPWQCRRCSCVGSKPHFLVSSTSKWPSDPKKTGACQGNRNVFHLATWGNRLANPSTLTNLWVFTSWSLRLDGKFWIRMRMDNLGANPSDIIRQTGFEPGPMRCRMCRISWGPITFWSPLVRCFADSWRLSGRPRSRHPHGCRFGPCTDCGSHPWVSCCFLGVRNLKKAYEFVERYDTRTTMNYNELLICWYHLRAAYRPLRRFMASPFGKLSITL